MDVMSSDDRRKCASRAGGDDAIRTKALRGDPVSSTPPYKFASRRSGHSNFNSLTSTGKANFEGAVHGFAPPGSERYHRAASKQHWARVHALLKRRVG